MQPQNISNPFSPICSQFLLSKVFYVQEINVYIWSTDAENKCILSKLPISMYDIFGACGLMICNVATKINTFLSTNLQPISIYYRIQCAQNHCLLLECRFAQNECVLIKLDISKKFLELWTGVQKKSLMRKKLRKLEILEMISTLKMIILSTWRFYALFTT